MKKPAGTKRRVLVKCIFKKGRAFIYDSVNPPKSFEYIPQESSAQTPKFVQRKKNILADIPERKAVTVLEIIFLIFL